MQGVTFRAAPKGFGPIDVSSAFTIRCSFLNRESHMQRAALLTYHWIASLVRFALGRSAYLVLYPPLFGLVHIYSRASQRLWRFVLRTGTTDAHSLVSVFLNEDYKVGSEAHAKQIKGTYDRLVRDGQIPLIVDCGANNGMSAAYFADNYPEAEIAAIEPHSGNIKVAEKNVIGEQVTFIEAAISSAPGMFDVSDAEADHNAFQFELASGGATRGITIDEIVAQFERQQGATPFLIKIDIEGFERDLFSQNTGWLDNFCVLFIELHDYMLPGQSNSRNFLKAIGPLDRDFLIGGDVVLSVRNQVAAEKAQRVAIVNKAEIHQHN